MKLKFSINYHTAWGESLHVCIDFHSQDGTVRHQDLLMQTDDGELWTLETSALMSRHHPLSHIQYRYQVENADEEVITYIDIQLCAQFHITDVESLNFDNLDTEEYELKDLHLDLNPAVKAMTDHIFYEDI